MITDALENAAAYYDLLPGIAVALRFLVDPQTQCLEIGKHQIDADRIFALVQEYNTKRRDECFWEAHRRFIDVQFVQTGIEAIAWAPIHQMRPSKPYDPKKDFEGFQGTGQTIQVPAGSFAIFMPHDVHMPGLAVGEPRLVRKIVVKVAVE